MNRIYRKVWNKELGQLVVASEFAKSDSAGVVQGEGGTAPVTRSLLAVVFASLFAVAGYGPAAFAQEWTVTDGATVGFQGDSNINVSVVPNGADATVEINLDPDLVVDSVTTGQTVMDNSGVAVGANVMLGASGLSITGGPSVTLAGIDAGNKVITNVAAGGNASDAVNFGQLQGVESSAQAAATAASVAQSTADNALTAAGNAQTTADAAVAAAGAGWDVSADSGSTANIGSGGSVAFSGDSNISVAQSGGDDAGAIKITLNPDLNVTSVTAGDTTVNNDGLTITGGPSVTASGLDAGGTKLTGLANGTVSADSTDAITGQQLHNVLFEGGSAFGVRYFRANSTADDSIAEGAESVAIGPNTVADGDSSFAAGDGATTTETGEGAIAIGQGAAAGGVPIGGAGAIAIGRQSQAGADSATALGDGASATGGNATALGASALASGGSSIAIGGAEAVSGNSFAAGSGAFAGSPGGIALGTGAGVGTFGDEAGDKTHHIAIGTSAGADVEGNQTTALGYQAGSQVTGDHNVAVGSHAGQGIRGDFNVAIGHEANREAGAVERATSIGGQTQAGRDGVAMGYGAGAADSGVSLGANTASGEMGVAVGRHARADGGSVALGSGSEALSADAAGPSYLTGDPFANGTVVSVGATNELGTRMTRRIVNVADGAQGHDAVNVNQLHAAQGAVATLIGGGVQANADGTFTPITVDVAGGGTATFNTVVEAIGAVTSGTVDILPVDAVRYNAQGGISNVSAGTAATDAVNVEQLNDAIAESGVKYFSVNSSNPSNRDNSTASGMDAVAIGPATSAGGRSSLAGGHLSHASGNQSVALGYEVEALGNNATAIGSSSDAYGDGAVAIGLRSISQGENSIVMGTDAQADPKSTDATVDNAIVIGTRAEATADNGIAIGESALASELRAVAQGYDAHATADDAMAFGSNSRASAQSAQASGTNASASGVNAQASGTNASAIGFNSIASGTGAVGYANNGIAMGTGAVTGIYDPFNQEPERNTAGIAIGNASLADGEHALALGVNASAEAESATAIGDAAEATGVGAFAAGTGAEATAQDALAMGTGASASEQGAMAFGQGAQATHEGSVALGAGSVTGDASPTSEGTVNEITYGGFAGTTPESVVSVGAAGDERQVTNVAAGRISETSTDAINGSQLFATQTVIGNVAHSTADILGGNAEVGDDGTITMTEVGGTEYDTVHEAIEYAAQGWNVSANGEDTANVAPGGSVDFSNTDGNIEITRDGTNLVFELADNIDVESLTAGDTLVDGTGVQVGDDVHLGDTGLVIDGGPSVTTGGIDAGGSVISNVGPGVAGTDAVNVNQLTQLAEAPLTFAGDTGADVERQLGDTVNLVGGAVGSLTDGNIGVVADGDETLTIQLAENIDLGGEGSVAIGDTTINNDGLTIDDGAGNETTIGAGTVTIAANPTTGPANEIVIDANTGTIGGLTNRTFDPDDITNGQAATEDQLGSVYEVANAGWNVSAQGENATNVGVNSETGNTVDLNNGDGNIVITKTDDSNDVTFDLADALEIGESIEVGGDTLIDGDGVAIGDDVHLGDTGLVIGDADGPRFTNDGISAGGQLINDVADGEADTDAVNVRQLEANRTKYYSVNDNGVVQGNYDNDGATGVNALAAGVNASAVGDRSVAMGAGAAVRPHPAGAANPDVDGPNVHDAVAIGTNAIVGNQRSMALGTNAQANKRDSIAIGTNAQVRWDGSASHNQTAGNIAIGTRAYTGTGSGSATVVGTGASSDHGNIQTAIGAGATVRGNITTAIGAHSIAHGDTSAAVGVRSQASGYDSIAFGTDSIAGIRGVSGTGTVLTSNAASAVGVRSVAQGSGSTAVGTGAHVFGNGSGAISSWVPTDPRIGWAENSDASFSIIGGTNNFAVGNRNVIGDSSEHNVALGSDIKIGASGASMERESVTVNGVTRHYYTPTFADAVAIQSAVAVGQAASVEASNSVAIGARATALNEGDVALGAGSVTADANPTSEGTVGDITYGDYAGSTPESVVSVGDVGAERQVTNVAAGRISEDSTDAINGSQLFATQTVIGNVAGSVVNVFGGNAELGDNGTITMTDIGETGENTIHDAIKTANDTANMGWHVAVGGEGASDGNNVGPGGLVDFSNDDGNIVISRDGTDLAFNLAENIDLGENGSLTTGNTVVNNDGLTVEDEDGNVNTVAADGTTVADADGNTTSIGAGTVAVTDGTGTTTIGGNAISVGGANPILISGDTGTIGGLQNQSIDYQGFADGSGRAATEEQLAQVNDTANMGWNISAQGENGTNVGPGGSVDLSNTDGNIVIAKEDDSNDVTFDLADDLVIGNSITAGDTYIDTTGVAIGADVHLGHTGLVITGGPSVTVAGIDAGNLVITNVAPGEISATSTDAINGSQLHGMGDSIVNVIGGNAELNPDGTITTSDVGGTGHDNIDDAIRAANDAANAGWTATDADGNAANIGPNGSVAFTGDGNISVAQTGEDNNGQVEITLNRDLDVDSITAGKTVIDTDGVQVGDNVHLGDTGLVIEGGPSVTTDGIDAGGSTLTNVAAGVNDTDAVNVGQLNQVAGDVNDLGDRMDVVEGDVADLQAGATGPFQVSQEAPLVPPTPTGANSAAGGSGADASGDNATALGNQAVASGENSTAVGQGAQATHDNSVALGQGSATTVGAQSGYDAAYVGSSDSAGEVNVGNRTITGVAPGVAGTDAVNVNQLNAGVNHAVVTANEYTDQRVNQVQSDVWHLHGRVDDLEKSINSGVATAMAMRQAPYVAGATTYFAGFGAYKDQGALGVSMRRTADNGRWSLEGGFSANRDGAGGYIGVSGVLGSK